METNSKRLQMSSCLWPMESYDFTVLDLKSITWNKSKAIVNKQNNIYSDHLQKKETGKTWQNCYSHHRCDSQPMPSGRPDAVGRGQGRRRKGPQLWSSASLQNVPPDHHLGLAALGRRRCWRNTPSILLLGQSSALWSGTGRSWSPLKQETEMRNLKPRLGVKPTLSFLTKLSVRLSWNGMLRSSWSDSNYLQSLRTSSLSQPPSCKVARSLCVIRSLKAALRTRFGSRWASARLTAVAISFKINSHSN